MLHIHFTTSDLLQVRIAPGADPMWEFLQSVNLAGGSLGEVEFGAWRRRCHRVLPNGLGLLGDLVRRCHPSAFLGTAGRALDARDVLAALRSASLGHGRANRLSGTETLVHRYDETALRPHWAQIRRHVGADVIRRRTSLAAGGVRVLLETLPSGVSWEDGRLFLAHPGAEQEVRLDGRGVLLQPTFFTDQAVRVLHQQGRPTVLAYAVTRPLGWFTAAAPDGGHLGEVLGQSRATILEALADRASTTTELAARLGLSLGSASQHAAKLGRSGLVTSIPRGKYVVHQLSPLGAELMETADTQHFSQG